MDGAVARAKLYLRGRRRCDLSGGADHAPRCSASSPRAMPGVPLLANMTEFGRTPFFTAAEFEAMGYRMVIWPVSALRVANKAQAELYAAISRDGGTQDDGRPDADPRRALRDDRLSRLRGARRLDRHDGDPAGAMPQRSLRP